MRLTQAILITASHYWFLGKMPRNIIPAYFSCLLIVWILLHLRR